MLAVLLAGALSSPGSAEEITRYDWVPGAYALGADAFGGNRVGDLWTFKCPRGGLVSASVDTMVDNSNEGAPLSSIDPLFIIRSGDGTLVVEQDDDFTCTVPQACGFSCPRAIKAPCLSGVTHSIQIYAGRSGPGTAACGGGGGYVLKIEVFDVHGVSQTETQVGLGGGPLRALQPWMTDQGAVKHAPLIDNGRLPM